MKLIYTQEEMDEALDRIRELEADLQFQKDLLAKYHAANCSAKETKANEVCPTCGRAGQWTSCSNIWHVKDSAIEPTREAMISLWVSGACLERRHDKWGAGLTWHRKVINGEPAARYSPMSDKT